MNDIKLISTVIDAQNRIALPPALCREHGLMPGDRLLVIDAGEIGPAPLCGYSLMLFKTGVVNRALGKIEEALDQANIASDDLQCVEPEERTKRS